MMLFPHVYPGNLVLVYEVISPGAECSSFKDFWKVQFADYDAYRRSIPISLPGQCQLVYYESLLILALFFSTGACVYQGSLLAVGLLNIFGLFLLNVKCLTEFTEWVRWPCHSKIYLFSFTVWGLSLILAQSYSIT